MDTGLEGKVCLITGGSSGIGLGIAKVLASEGVNLAIAALAPDPSAVEELRAFGVRVEAMDIDVSEEDRVLEMVRRTLSVLGRIDLYVNNAAGTWHRPITRLTTESLTKTMATNLYACVWACREVAKHMIERREGGSILIIGSTAMLAPLYRESAYRMSKASLVYFAEVLAIELAPYHIRVNVIIPGFHLTRLSSAGLGPEALEKIIKEIPLRRPGRVEEIGYQAAMLLSDKLSGYTTGASLVIDGGLHLRPLPFLSDQELAALNAPDVP
jgi:NAD(P)-dependent dehydrogenase (short-subunit alcohol dehydrogenase family)